MHFTVTILHSSTFPDTWHTEHSLQFSSCKTFLSRGIWLLFFTGKLLKYSSPATDCTVELCKKITKRDSSNLEYEDRMTKENNCLVQQCLIYYCKLFFSRQSGEKKKTKPWRNQWCISTDEDANNCIYLKLFTNFTSNFL